MGSGQKREVLNTQERILSTDHNRAQAFLGSHIAELLRAMLNTTQGSDDLDAAAIQTTFSSSANPLRAEIFSGLLVRPTATTLEVLVEAGTVALIDPDSPASTDDSPYKVITDPGVTASGTLVIGAGAGSTRIDVIECSRVTGGESTLESDNRDVFDEVSGLFVPASLPKVRAGRLQYRVRVGTPGAGFPGTAAGWLPLAVVSVPTSATSVDGMTFWDVRPMIQDRSVQPFAIARTRPRIHKALVNAASVNAVTGTVDVDGPAIAGCSRRLGGMLRSGSVVADADNINCATAANQEPGISFTANRPWYLYLLTPFGLPRWARYTASGTRVPRSPRGIPVVSMTAPDTDGNPSAAISLPTLTGLGSNTAVGVAVAAGFAGSGGTQGAFFGDNENGYTLVSTDGGTTDPLPHTATTSLSGAPVAGLCRYDLTAGTHYPPHARALLCEFRASFACTFGSPFWQNLMSALLLIFSPNGGSQLTQMRLDMKGGVYQNVDPQSTSADHLIWVPLPSVYPTLAAPTQRFDMRYEAGGSVSAMTSGTLKIWGWKF